MGALSSFHPRNIQSLEFTFHARNIQSLEFTYGHLWVRNIRSLEFTFHGRNIQSLDFTDVHLWVRRLSLFNRRCAHFHLSIRKICHFEKSSERIPLLISYPVARLCLPSVRDSSFMEPVSSQLTSLACKNTGKKLPTQMCTHGAFHGRSH